MNKLIKSFLAFVLVFSSLVYLNNETEASQSNYTGEEIFKGFIFAQGEVGEKLKDNFNDNQYEVLNNNESVEIANFVVNKINEKDNEYFKNLKAAVYNSDPLKVDELMVYGGEMAEEIISNNYEQEAKESELGFQTASTAVAVETVLVGVLAAIVTVVLTQIDATPIAAKEGVDKEAYIDELITELN